MTKLQAGQWFKRDGESILLTATMPDTEGDYIFAVPVEEGFARYYLHKDQRDELKPTRRVPWLSTRTVTRPISQFAFRAFYAPNGRDAVIVAGCRTFSIAQAKAHWSTRERRLTWTSEVSDQIDAWSFDYVTKLEERLAKVRAGKAA